MKPTTLEWIHKAEEDWHVAQMSYRARKYPSYDAAVFHAQQCAEKYLKARLSEAAIGFSRTHDLLMLHQLVVPVEPNWQVLQTPLAFLSPFAVAYRYPGIIATRADARDAIRQHDLPENTPIPRTVDPRRIGDLLWESEKELAQQENEKGIAEYFPSPNWRGNGGAQHYALDCLHLFFQRPLQSLMMR